MDWEIRADLGRHVRTGIDAHGWRWDITRGTEVAQVVIEISGRAWASDPLSLPEDTRHALETDGHDDPPRVIRCGYCGCSYLSAGELGERPGRT